MKTKVVYILVSNEKDYYLEQALVSIYSFRLYNSNAELLLVVDEETSKTLSHGIRKSILDYVSRLIVVNIPEVFSNLQKSRFIKTSLRELIEGDFLFIDSDTIICDNLEDIDNMKEELLAVPDCHLSIKYSWMKNKIRKWANILNWKFSENDYYFNSGVLFVKDTDTTHKFYEQWHLEWKKHLSNGINYDQPSFAKANETMNYIINKLDGIWNCQVNSNGLPYLMNSKIIHYFASGIGTKKDSPYQLLDKQLFIRIKTNGYLNDEIKQLVLNAKSAFTPYCSIIGFYDAQFLFSRTYWLYAQHPTAYKCIDTLSRIILFISHLIK